MIMKNLLTLFMLAACTAVAQVPPFIRNSLDTNSEAVAMGIVTNAASIPLALQSGTSLDWSGGAHEKRLFRAITTDTTFTFANLPTSATNSVTLVLYLTNNGPAGVASVTFPAAVQWPQTFGAPTILQVSNTVTRYEFEHMGGGRVFGYDRSRFTVLAAGSGVTLTSSGPTTTVATATSGFPLTQDGNGNKFNITNLQSLRLGYYSALGSAASNYWLAAAQTNYQAARIYFQHFADPTESGGAETDDMTIYDTTNSLGAYRRIQQVAMNGLGYSVSNVMGTNGAYMDWRVDDTDVPDFYLSTLRGRARMHFSGEQIITNNGALHGFRFTNGTMFAYATNGPGHSIVFRQRWTNSMLETAVSSNGSAFTVIQVITASGNVGIWTNAPQSSLHVVGTNQIHAGSVDIFTGNIVGNPAFGSIGNALGGTSGATMSFNGNIIYFTKSDFTGQATLDFGAASGKLSLSAGLTAQGNVGIGTVTPLQLLHVTNGVIRTDGGIGSYATNAVLTIGATGVTNTLTVNAIAYEFAGTSVVHTRQNGNTFSRGTISAGIDIVLKPGESLTGSLCSSVTNLMAW